MLELLDEEVYYPKTKKDFPIVTEKDYGIRPAGKQDECFFCGSKIGERHKNDCVVCCKKVKLRATIEFVTDVPFSWNKEEIEFHYNGGTWCADNLIEDLKKWIEKEDDYTCMCPYTKIELVEE